MGEPGEVLGPEPFDSRALVLRYLAAFGPAGARDAETCSGKTRRELTEEGKALARFVEGDARTAEVRFAWR